MVVVRKARDKDIPGYIDCYSKVWKSFRGILPERYVEGVIKEAGQPSFPKKISSAIMSPDRILLVAENKGKIVGLAQGRVNRGGYSWLGFIGVVPENRRQSIGKTYGFYY